MIKSVFYSFIAAILLSTSIAFAGGFDAQDKEANDVAMFMKNMLNGAELERALYEQYPNSKIEWAGRCYKTGDPRSVYLVYCEITAPNKEPIYLWFEVTFTFINSDPELVKKYFNKEPDGRTISN